MCDQREARVRVSELVVDIYRSREREKKETGEERVFFKVLVELCSWG